MSSDDQRFIDAARAGDTDAFGVLVRRYQDRLYAAIHPLMNGRAEDAQDVVQEAFLHAYQALHSFKGDALFFTWLYRIAVNAAISHLRKRRTVLSLDGIYRGGLDPLDRSSASKPAEGLEQAEREQRVRNALSRLSPEHRAVLIMKDMEEQKYEEMAETLGVPIGTIRSRLHRARLELRELLEQDED